MTLTTPRRFIILHFSHLTLTEACTFMFNLSHYLYLAVLLKPIGNPAPTQVIRGKLDQYLIAGYDFDIMHPYLT